MGFQLDISVPALTVFLQGLLSFFSPCVLPLVPLYIGYLAGGMKTADEDGTIRYPKKKVMINTLFFIIGVSFAFFLLGFGFTAAGRFFTSNRAMFARIGGILIVLFGLYQLGFFGSKLLGGEHRLPFRLDKMAMNPATALIMGFTFSFAWTPCVGPALASVLLMVSSANSAGMGFLLIGVYTLGFVLPFLAVGLFTSRLLTLFRKYSKVVRYTVKAGGVLMVLMGVMMFTGWMNGITGYLSNFGGTQQKAEVTQQEKDTVAQAPNEGGQPENSGAAGSGQESAETSETQTSDQAEKAPASQNDREVLPAIDFTLTDQFGTEHTLSDYKGKVVFLNFWASWCGPCKREMPDIQKLYEEYGYNEEDLVVLGIANPKSEEYPYNQDTTVEELTQFLEDRGYTYPVVMDTTGEMFEAYGIFSFPTTFMIDKDGNVYGYVSGSISKDMMDNIVKQVMEAESQTNK